VWVKLNNYFGFVTLLSTLWNVRNKFSVEGKFPTQPVDCIYKMSVYLQVWKPMPRRSDREALELTIGRIHALHASV
jgi:hypothetical protein